MSKQKKNTLKALKGMSVEDWEKAVYEGAMELGNLAFRKPSLDDISKYAIEHRGSAPDIANKVIAICEKMSGICNLIPLVEDKKEKTK